MNGALLVLEGSSGSQALRPQVVRAFECVVFVGVWMAAGFALHLGAIAYLLAGVPLTVAFQVLVTRRPIVSLWVLRADTAARLGKRLLVLAAGLAATPIWVLVRDSIAHRWMSAAWALAAVLGALPAAFAFTRLRRADVQSLVLCFATAGVIGVFIVVSGALAAHAHQAGAAPTVAIAVRVRTAIQDFLCFVPVTFVLEEVTFRGALDAHVHRDGDRRGLVSAVFVSAMWGIWHLPVVAQRPSLAVGLVLVIVHTLIGVPLTIFWRRSGNLAVPAVVHAFIDAVRDAALVR